MIIRHLLVPFLLLLPLSAKDKDPQADLPASIITFLENNCYDCHDSFDQEGELDLETLSFDKNDRSSLTRWAYILDRVHDGEMPPKKKLDEAERSRFLKELEQTLHATSLVHQQTKGRVRSRRLNRIEYEKTLHHLLGIDLPLAQLLPEDPAPKGFSNIAESQQLSHHLLEKHLHLIDLSLDEAFRRALTPSPAFKKTLTADQIGHSYATRRGSDRQAILHEGLAISISSNNNYHGRVPNAAVPEDGWYRITITAKAHNPPAGRGIWTQIHRGFISAKAPTTHWVGSFLAGPKLQTHSFETWMDQGHLLEIRPGDNTLSKVTGKTVAEGRALLNPKSIGTAVKSLTIKRIHRGLSDAQIKKILFGKLTLKDGKLHSDTPEKDLAKLIRRFATRAFRRPVEVEELASYQDFALQTFTATGSLTQALLSGYRALLSSPRVLFFTEKLGPLDDYSIASRLSYFLWSGPPDSALLKAAQKGQLSDPQILRKHSERLLNDPRSAAFIKNFSDSWLGLKDIDFTNPDPQLYPEFDSILKNSMLAETRAFLREMLDHDLSVTNVIHSDFAMLNERLAHHYQIPQVTSPTLRKVPLTPAQQKRRGGLITHGSILKVSANGTTTSPIIRGVWLLENILGIHIPPPPDDVPAVEPDIRGAISIRDQLDKHRSTESCNACHVKIDPPGFALENFDVIGGWRNNYRALKSKGKRKKKNTWKPGQPVDASYQFTDGSQFHNISDFKKNILSQPRDIAYNILDKLLTYSTGATIEFADRRALDEILNSLSTPETSEGAIGFRSLIHATIQSEIFQSK